MERVKLPVCLINALVSLLLKSLTLYFTNVFYMSIPYHYFSTEAQLPMGLEHGEDNYSITTETHSQPNFLD